MSLVATRFDYSKLSPISQDTLRNHARRLSQLVQNAATDLWRMGQILSQAQDELAHHGTGRFLDWLETETGLSQSTAYRLMNVYKTFDLPTVGRIQAAPSVLYTLAEGTTPVQAREEVLLRAQRGEQITREQVQTIIAEYKPRRPPLPPLPEKPPLPPKPEPTPEFREFERDELMPHFEDAGNVAAPQLITGMHEAPVLPTEEAHEHAAASLREQIVTQLLAFQDGQEPDITADEILEIVGQASNSITLAAHFGIALSKGPLALADLTEIACKVAGVSVSQLDRGEYLGMRKKVLRLVDSLTYSGCGVYEHKLANGQLVYGLDEC